MYWLRCKKNLHHSPNPSSPWNTLHPSHTYQIATKSVKRCVCFCRDAPWNQTQILLLKSSRGQKKKRQTHTHTDTRTHTDAHTQWCAGKRSMTIREGKSRRRGLRRARVGRSTGCHRQLMDRWTPWQKLMFHTLTNRTQQKNVKTWNK